MAFGVGAAGSAGRGSSGRRKRCVKCGRKYAAPKWAVCDDCIGNRSRKLRRVASRNPVWAGSYGRVSEVKRVL